jgi:hypothetical protein
MTRFVILAVGFLVLFVGGGARFAIGLALKPIAQELGVGRSALGLAVACYLVVMSVCMFRRSPRRPARWWSWPASRSAPSA